MIDYPYTVETVDYRPAVKTGVFRRRTVPARLELGLRSPDWCPPGSDLREAFTRLTGADAEAWRRVAVTTPVRVYGRPAPGQEGPLPPGDRIVLDITRIKRGHRRFPTTTSHQLKEAPST
ncbi:MAG TPA: hypothetical protein VF885_09670 [Arthrobacter sp.]